MKKIALSIAVLMAKPVNADVITFDSLPHGEFSSLTTDGFVLERTGEGISYVSFGGPGFCWPTCVYNGTNHIMTIADLTFTLRRQDGHSFNFYGFEAGEAHIERSAFWATTIQLLGLRDDGSVVVEDFDLDWINDGDGELADFQPFIPAENFTNIISLSFDGYGSENQLNFFSFDNLLVGDIRDVPEPSGIALLGWALGCWRFKSWIRGRGTSPSHSAI